MKKMIDIPFGSSRYDNLVELRYKVLLEPLGLKFLDMHRDKEAGYSRLVMHAMLSVVNFYEKMGYRQEGEIFEDQGITFARMVKDLA